MNLRDEPAIQAFIREAQQLTSLMESKPSEPEGWVRELLVALSGTYHHVFAMMDRMEQVVLERESGLIPQDGADRPTESCAVVWANVQEALGGRNFYFLSRYDRMPEPGSAEALPGLLSEDLSDLYADFAPYIRLWQQNRPEHDIEILKWLGPITFRMWGPRASRTLFMLHEALEKGS